MSDGMACPRCAGALREGDSEWLCECMVCGRHWPPPANLVAKLAAAEAERDRVKKTLRDVELDLVTLLRSHEGLFMWTSTPVVARHLWAIVERRFPERAVALRAALAEKEGPPPSREP